MEQLRVALWKMHGNPGEGPGTQIYSHKQLIQPFFRIISGPPAKKPGTQDVPMPRRLQLVSIFSNSSSRPKKALGTIRPIRIAKKPLHLSQSPQWFQLEYLQSIGAGPPHACRAHSWRRCRRKSGVFRPLVGGVLNIQVSWRSESDPICVREMVALGFATLLATIYQPIHFPFNI